MKNILKIEVLKTGSARSKRLEKIKKKGEDKKNIIMVDKKMLNTDWTKCPKCNTKVKSKNLAHHVKQRHHKKLEIERVIGTINKTQIAFKIIVVITLVICILSYMIYILPEKSETLEKDNIINNGNSSENGNPQENGELQENNNQENKTRWLENYSAKYLEGSGDDDWWINYPDQHPDSNTTVNHPKWVLDSLENKPVVILVHSDRCDPCIQQQEDIEEALEEYGEEVEYYDIMSDGNDDRANEAFESYDPNDEQNYIPLTVMVSLIEDKNGDNKITWHSAEGATGKEWIKDYMKDSIYYYYKNNNG